MGWWTQDETGSSFAHAEGEEMMWGDSVADIMDAALAAIGETIESRGEKITHQDIGASMTGGVLLGLLLAESGFLRA